MKLFNSKLFKSDTLIICTWAIVLTAIFGVSIVWLQSIYYDNYSYFYDPVSYSLGDISLYMRWQEESRFSLALSEWLNNPRHPYRTIPTILLAPHLLGHELGYIATALPALLSFLILLGLTVRNRSKSILYAIACCFLFCALPGLSNLVYGLGTYWTDLVAALFAGSATLCLLNSHEGKSKAWLVSFSIFAALACLSRYIAVVYVAFCCGPIALIYLVRGFRKNPSIYRSVLQPIWFACIPFFLIAGFFLISQFPFNYSFYTVFGYDIKETSLAALQATLNFLFNSFFERPIIILLTIIFCANLFLKGRLKSLDYWNLIIAFWLIVSVPLLLVFLGSTDAFHTRMYAVPLIFVMSVSPISKEEVTARKSHLRRFQVFVSIVIITISLLALGQRISDNYNIASSPSADVQDLKRLDTQLADILAREKEEQKPLVWLPFFDEYGHTPVAETFYQHGKYVNLSSKPAFGYSLLDSSTLTMPIFSMHRAYWEGTYPGLTPEQLKRQVYREALATVDIIVVYEDPQWSQTLPWLDNPYTIAVSKHMARRVPQDERWQRLSPVIQTSRYGNLVPYRNRTR